VAILSWIFTPLGIAVASFMVVVLMAGDSERTGVLIVGIACLALTAMTICCMARRIVLNSFGSWFVAAIGIDVLALQFSRQALFARANGLLDITRRDVRARFNDTIFWNRGAKQLYG
jgi:hypothetical protein